jgi:hypothetical protein
MCSHRSKLLYLCMTGPVPNGLFYFLFFYCFFFTRAVTPHLLRFRVGNFTKRIPTKRILTKRIFTKRILTKCILTKRILTKRILTKRILTKCILTKRILTSIYCTLKVYYTKTYTNIPEFLSLLLHIFRLYHRRQIPNFMNRIGIKYTVRAWVKAFGLG